MQSSPLFRNGTCNQLPPEGAVRSQPSRAPGAFRESGDQPGEEPLATSPFELTREDLETARAHFETFCGPCHGLLGDSHTQVAENMEYRKPPALIEATVRALPDGTIYQVISEGYGFMPSYAHALTSQERWAVVAYVRALQLSQWSELDNLPARYREEARTWLR